MKKVSEFSAKETGKLGESVTCYYLIKKGYIIRRRNYVVRGGEIDIIAEKDGILAFVEVKTRKRNSLATGFDAITKAKKRRIIKAAQKFMIDNNIDYLQPRYDSVQVILEGTRLINFRYIENSYDATGLGGYIY